ncbi:hypothetical protein HPB47_011132 [Ixodes persulcatus]|uniref:Uncharacterized protein n=1 Tax=Ixodes persulcatus TaxID=34615 RepID=A0AC60NX69_IXOPE|nr:hypothetical protein HPB47_011132 [Ixodes persulcatus]
MYDNTRKNVKAELNRAFECGTTAVAFTSDMWTSRANESYHHGGSKFLAAVHSTEAAEKYVVQDNLLLGNVVVLHKQVGPRTVYESVFRLSPHVPDDALQAVLGAYDKILGVSHLTYKDRPTLFSGARVVRMKMTKKCPTSSTSWTPRHVRVPGHAASLCPAAVKRAASERRATRRDATAAESSATPPRAVPVTPCKRCGHNHATTDCAQRRSYSAVAQAVCPPDPWTI